MLFIVKQTLVQGKMLQDYIEDARNRDAAEKQVKDIVAKRLNDEFQLSPMQSSLSGSSYSNERYIVKDVGGKNVMEVENDSAVENPDAPLYFIDVAPSLNTDTKEGGVREYYDFEVRDVEQEKSDEPRFHSAPPIQSDEQIGDYGRETGRNTDDITRAEPKTTPAKQIQDGPTTFLERMYDRYRRFYNTVKEIEELTGRKLTDDENPYQYLTKITARAQARFESFYEYTMMPLMQHIGEMAKKLPARTLIAGASDAIKQLGQSSEILQLIGTYHKANPVRAFDLYMIAKHAPYRNAWIEAKTDGNIHNGSGVTNEEAAAVVEIFEKHFTQDEIDKFWQLVEKATDTSLNAWVGTGRITKAGAKAMKDGMKYYVFYCKVKPFG